MKTFDEEYDAYKNAFQDAEPQWHVFEPTKVGHDTETMPVETVSPNGGTRTPASKDDAALTEYAKAIPQCAALLPTASTMDEKDLIEPLVALDSVRLDGGTQSRVALNDAVIDEYTDALCDGATLPPLMVYFDGVDFWLADGFHRYHAYRAASVDLASAVVRSGSRRDAVLFSVGANAAHGLRRTNADKRRAVETLLADAEWATWSDNQIAKASGVSNHLVADVKASVTLNSPSDAAPIERTYTTKHGTTASMNTANIGKAKSAEERYSGEINAPAAAAANDAGDVAALRAENAELRQELDELKESFAETLADNESMGRVFDADDRPKVAMAGNKRLVAVAESAERFLRAKSGELAEAIRSVKYWKNRADKFERLLNKAAA